MTATRYSCLIGLGFTRQGAGIHTDVIADTLSKPSQAPEHSISAYMRNTDTNAGLWPLSYLSTGGDLND
jgi:hypothetical protein